MKEDFYNPYIIWSGIWLFICLVVLIILAQTDTLYWQAGIERERLLSRGGFHGVFAKKFGFPPESQNCGPFSSFYRYTLTRPGGEAALPFSLEPEIAGEPREFWVRPQVFSSFPERDPLQHDWLPAWKEQIRAGQSYNIISYFLFIVGFGAICFISALYQNHFRKAQEAQFEAELESRNLRIQVLESSRKALDLRLTLLDQVHAKAQASAREAQKTMAALEEKVRAEADRNEELQAELQTARQEESAALRLLRVLENDRQKIAAEQSDILSRLAEAEKWAGEDLFNQKIGKAKKRVRLNSSWLNSLYRNLAFSPRALQNLNEVQEAPDVFPSLPDALSIINGLTLETLESGENLPPKTLARFGTQDLVHFQGPFWEYRFSSHGRIFFGLSQSRTWSIDTILLKRRFPDKKEKYDRYLATTLGKDNQDLKWGLLP